ncbi:uncharacterized protein LOC135695274 [Rhopilema esculentum]|uniref:uncharacterized protein LOC135695274 n=1 Tax=Rhopilema esculentum TaxID=499914 RepID=UPI0031D56455
MDSRVSDNSIVPKTLLEKDDFEYSASLDGIDDSLASSASIGSHDKAGDEDSIENWELKDDGSFELYLSDDCSEYEESGLTFQLYLQPDSPTNPHLPDYQYFHSSDEPIDTVSIDKDSDFCQSDSQNGEKKSEQRNFVSITGENTKEDGISSKFGNSEVYRVVICQTVSTQASSTSPLKEQEANLLTERSSAVHSENKPKVQLSRQRGVPLTVGRKSKVGTKKNALKRTEICANQNIESSSKVDHAKILQQLVDGKAGRLSSFLASKGKPAVIKVFRHTASQTVSPLDILPRTGAENASSMKAAGEFENIVHANQDDCLDEKANPSSSKKSTDSGSQDERINLDSFIKKPDASFLSKGQCFDSPCARQYLESLNRKRDITFSEQGSDKNSTYSRAGNDSLKKNYDSDSANLQTNPDCANRRQDPGTEGKRWEIDSSNKREDPCSLDKRPAVDSSKKRSDFDSSNNREDPCSMNKKQEKRPDLISSSKIKDPCSLDKKEDPVVPDKRQDLDSSNQREDPCSLDKKQYPDSTEKGPDLDSSNQREDPCSLDKKENPVVPDKRQDLDSSNQREDPCSLDKKQYPDSTEKRPDLDYSNASEDPCSLGKKENPVVPDKRQDLDSSNQREDPCSLDKKQYPDSTEKRPDLDYSNASEDPCSLDKKQYPDSSEKGSDLDYSNASEEPCSKDKRPNPDSSEKGSDLEFANKIEDPRSLDTKPDSGLSEKRPVFDCSNAKEYPCSLDKKLDPYSLDKRPDPNSPEKGPDLNSLNQREDLSSSDNRPVPDSLDKNPDTDSAEDRPNLDPSERKEDLQSSDNRPVPDSLDKNKDPDSAEDRPNLDLSERKEDAQSSDNRPVSDSLDKNPDTDSAEDRPNLDPSERKEDLQSSANRPVSDSLDKNPDTDSAEDRPNLNPSERRENPQSSDNRPVPDSLDKNRDPDSAEDRPNLNPSERKEDIQSSNNRPVPDSLDKNRDPDSAEDRPNLDPSERKEDLQSSNNRPVSDSLDKNPDTDSAEDRPNLNPSERRENPQSSDNRPVPDSLDKNRDPDSAEDRPNLDPSERKEDPQSSNNRPVSDSLDKNPDTDSAEDRPNLDPSERKEDPQSSNNRPVSDSLDKNPDPDSAEDRPNLDPSERKEDLQSSDNRPVSDSLDKNPDTDSAEDRPNLDPSERKEDLQSSDNRPVSDSLNKNPDTDSAEDRPNLDPSERKEDLQSSDNRPVSDSLNKNPDTDSAEDRPNLDPSERKEDLQSSDNRPVSDSLNKNPDTDSAEDRPNLDPSERKEDLQSSDNRPVSDSLNKNRDPDSVEDRPNLDSLNKGENLYSYDNRPVPDSLDKNPDTDSVEDRPNLDPSERKEDLQSSANRPVSDSLDKNPDTDSAEDRSDLNSSNVSKGPYFSDNRPVCDKKPGAGSSKENPGPEYLDKKDFDSLNKITDFGSLNKRPDSPEKRLDFDSPNKEHVPDSPEKEADFNSSNKNSNDARNNKLIIKRLGPNSLGKRTDLNPGLGSKPSMNELQREGKRYTLNKEKVKVPDHVKEKLRKLGQISNKTKASPKKDKTVLPMIDPSHTTGNTIGFINHASQMNNPYVWYPYVSMMDANAFLPAYGALETEIVIPIMIEPFEIEREKPGVVGMTSIGTNTMPEAEIGTTHVSTNTANRTTYEVQRKGTSTNKSTIATLRDNVTDKVSKGQEKSERSSVNTNGNPLGGLSESQRNKADGLAGIALDENIVSSTLPETHWCDEGQTSKTHRIAKDKPRILSSLPEAQTFKECQADDQSQGDKTVMSGASQTCCSKVGPENKTTRTTSSKQPVSDNIPEAKTLEECEIDRTNEFLSSDQTMISGTSKTGSSRSGSEDKTGNLMPEKQTATDIKADQSCKEIPTAQANGLLVRNQNLLSKSSKMQTFDICGSNQHGLLSADKPTFPKNTSDGNHIKDSQTSKADGNDDILNGFPGSVAGRAGRGPTGFQVISREVLESSNSNEGSTDQIVGLIPENQTALSSHAGMQSREVCQTDHPCTKTSDSQTNSGKESENPYDEAETVEIVPETTTNLVNMQETQSCKHVDQKDSCILESGNENVSETEIFMGGQTDTVVPNKEKRFGDVQETRILEELQEVGSCVLASSNETTLENVSETEIVMDGQTDKTSAVVPNKEKRFMDVQEPRGLEEFKTITSCVLASGNETTLENVPETEIVMDGKTDKTSAVVPNKERNLGDIQETQGVKEFQTVPSFVLASGNETTLENVPETKIFMDGQTNKTGAVVPNKETNLGDVQETTLENVPETLLFEESKSYKNSGAAPDENTVLGDLHETQSQNDFQTEESCSIASDNKSILNKPETALAKEDQTEKSGIIVPGKEVILENLQKNQSQIESDSQNVLNDLPKSPLLTEVGASKIGTDASGSQSAPSKPSESQNLKAGRTDRSGKLGYQIISRQMLESQNSQNDASDKKDDMKAANQNVLSKVSKKQSCKKDPQDKTGELESSTQTVQENVFVSQSCKLGPLYKPFAIATCAPKKKESKKGKKRKRNELPPGAQTFPFDKPWVFAPVDPTISGIVPENHALLSTNESGSLAFGNQRIFVKVADLQRFHEGLANLNNRQQTSNQIVFRKIPEAQCYSECITEAGSTKKADVLASGKKNCPRQLPDFQKSRDGASSRSGRLVPNNRTVSGLLDTQSFKGNSIRNACETVSPDLAVLYKLPSTQSSKEIPAVETGVLVPDTCANSIKSTYEQERPNPTDLYRFPSTESSKEGLTVETKQLVPDNRINSIRNTCELLLHIQTTLHNSPSIQKSKDGPTIETKGSVPSNGINSVRNTNESEHPIETVLCKSPSTQSSPTVETKGSVPSNSMNSVGNTCEPVRPIQTVLCKPPSTQISKEGPTFETKGSVPSNGINSVGNTCEPVRPIQTVLCKPPSTQISKEGPTFETKGSVPSNGINSVGNTCEPVRPIQTVLCKPPSTQISKEGPTFETKGSVPSNGINSVGNTCEPVRPGSKVLCTLPSTQNSKEGPTAESNGWAPDNRINSIRNTCEPERPIQTVLCKPPSTQISKEGPTFETKGSVPSNGINSVGSTCEPVRPGSKVLCTLPSTQNSKEGPTAESNGWAPDNRINSIRNARELERPSPVVLYKLPSAQNSKEGPTVENNGLVPGNGLISDKAQNQKDTQLDRTRWLANYIHILPKPVIKAPEPCKDEKSEDEDVAANNQTISKSLASEVAEQLIAPPQETNKKHPIDISLLVSGNVDVQGMNFENNGRVLQGQELKDILEKLGSFFKGKGYVTFKSKENSKTSVNPVVDGKEKVSTPLTLPKILQDIEENGITENRAKVESGDSKLHPSKTLLINCKASNGCDKNKVAQVSHSPDNTTRVVPSKKRTRGVNSDDSGIHKKVAMKSIVFNNLIYGCSPLLVSSSASLGANDCQQQLPRHGRKRNSKQATKIVNSGKSNRKSSSRISSLVWKNIRYNGELIGRKRTILESCSTLFSWECSHLFTSRKLLHDRHAIANKLQKYEVRMGRIMRHYKKLRASSVPDQRDDINGEAAPQIHPVKDDGESSSKEYSLRATASEVPTASFRSDVVTVKADASAILRQKASRLSQDFCIKHNIRSSSDGGFSEKDLSRKEKDISEEKIKNKIQRASLETSIVASNPLGLPRLSSIPVCIPSDKASAAVSKVVAQECISHKRKSYDTNNNCECSRIIDNMDGNVFQHSITKLARSLSKHVKKRKKSQMDGKCCSKCGTVLESPKELTRHMLYHLVDKAVDENFSGKSAKRIKLKHINVNESEQNSSEVFESPSFRRKVPEQEVNDPEHKNKDHNSKSNKNESSVLDGKTIEYHNKEHGGKYGEYDRKEQESNDQGNHAKEQEDTDKGSMVEHDGKEDVNKQSDGVKSRNRITEGYWKDCKKEIEVNEREDSETQEQTGKENETDLDNDHSTENSQSKENVMYKAQFWKMQEIPQVGEDGSAIQDAGTNDESAEKNRVVWTPLYFDVPVKPVMWQCMNCRKKFKGMSDLKGHGENCLAEEKVLKNESFVWKG